MSHTAPLLVAYGHSWVAGDGASRPDRRFVEVAARSLGMTAVNLGVGGSASADTARLVQEAGVPAAALYVVLTGLNDARLAGTARAGLDAYGLAVRGVVDACRAAAPGAPVLVVDQPVLVDYSRFAPHDQGSNDAVGLYNGVLRSAFDGLDGLDGVVLVEVTGWDPATMLAADTVHPNDAGHAEIAESVVSAYRAYQAYRASAIGSTSPVHD